LLTGRSEFYFVFFESKLSFATASLAFMTLIYLLIALVTGILPHEGDQLIVGSPVAQLQLAADNTLCLNGAHESDYLQFHLPSEDPSKFPISFSEFEYELEISEASDLVKDISSYFDFEVVEALPPTRPSPDFFKRHLFHPEAAPKIILYQVFLI
jgi:hypothetical protein